APVRGDDIEIPAQVVLTYFNLKDDYAAGTVSSDRLIGRSTKIQQTQLPLVLTPTKAQQVADAMVLDAKVSADEARITLTDYYAALQPADVVTVVDEDNTSYRFRIARETYGRGIKALEMPRDDASVLSSVGITDDSRTASIVVDPPGDTTLYLLD